MKNNSRNRKSAVTDNALPPCPAGLQDAWKRGKLVLFLGAGVSQPYGLPSWNDLVLTLLLDESSRIFDKFWPHYRVPLGSWLAETFGLTPVTMARLAREYAAKNFSFDGARFRQYVRDELYRFRCDPKEPTTLSGVVDLLVSSEKHPDKWRIPVVVPLNFDDLLERKLKQKKVDFTVVSDNERRDDDKLAILHIHGYLPAEGVIPDGDIVFTEDEYHRISFTPFHWSQTEVINLLRNYTVVFIGSSMSDPNLRRLLDASHAPKSGTNHFVLKAQYDLSPDQKNSAYQTIAERARLQAMKLGIEDAEKSQFALEHAVDSMLRQARQYDTDLLRHLGVETIWFKDFVTMAKFISAIPHAGREKAKAAGSRR